MFSCDEIHPQVRNDDTDESQEEKQETERTGECLTHLVYLVINLHLPLFLYGPGGRGERKRRTAALGRILRRVP